MKRIVGLLAISVGCATSNVVRTPSTPATLAVEQRTTLHVGELAVLKIPSDRRYSRYSNADPDGAWRRVFGLVKRSRRDMTFRAMRPGSGAIIISPNVPNGECISCATLHYFIEVVAQK